MQYLENFHFVIQPPSLFYYFNKLSSQSSFPFFFFFEASFILKYQSIHLPIHLRITQSIGISIYF